MVTGTISARGALGQGDMQAGCFGGLSLSVGITPALVAEALADR